VEALSLGRRPLAALSCVGALGLAGLAALGRPAVEPREPPAAATAQSLDPSPEACAECHEAIVDEWRSSLHAASWTDPVFRAEYDPAPAASCRGCHDPPSAAPGVHGIDCASCHVRGAEILATGSSPAARAAHPIRVDPELASVERCGDCHQFNYSEDGVHDPTEALQATVEEWRASEPAARRRGCVSCHMPRELEHRSHRFPGMADPQLLSSAIDLEFDTRRTDAGVEVTVRARGREIGHAFPTGDVFRRAVLTIATEHGVEARVLMQRWLALTADRDGEDSHVRTVDDTRIPPPGAGEFEHTLHLADPDATRLEWSLELHRLPLGHARQRGLPDATTIVPVARGSSWLGD
jgi:hypothetical protein